MKETVAIILVNWNGFDVTKNCILSLKASVSNNYTIILVDNDSADGSGDRLHELFPDMIFIRSPKNLGFAGGNNLGIEYSLKHNFTYTLLLNNDTVVNSGFLHPLIEYLKLHPETGAVQPKIFFHHNPKRLWNAGSYFNKWIGFTYTKGVFRLDGSAYNKLKKVDWISGCAFMIKNDVLIKTGFLAEDLFMYYEDVDLSLRIRQKGYNLIYIPSSIIYHIGGAASKTGTKKKEGRLSPMVHYYNQRNKIWVMKQHLPWYTVPSSVFVNLLHVLAFSAYFIARRRFEKLHFFWNGILDGLTGKLPERN